MPLPFPFDFKNPDYHMVFEWRLERYQRLLKEPEKFGALSMFYKDNPGQYIIDWGCTSDPRHVEIGLPTTIPFLLFPKQEDWVNWFIERWKNREFGLCEKSRDVGVTWLAGALAATICMFNEGVIIGFGSRKAEYVDKLGDPKCIFYKIRQFISLSPSQFNGGWKETDKNCSKIMNINVPHMNSNILGEAGDNIGRGNRTSIYIKDESAHFEHPEQIDAALSATSNCCIDLSTPCGNANPFARKRFSWPESRIFSFRWQDDPRKDQEWYEKKKLEIDDPIIIAQELDLDYNASLEGVVIPNVWVIAAIDAHIKLGVEPKGIRKIGYDVADEGRDKNAVCGRYGVLIEYLEEFSGKNSDIYASTQYVFGLCDSLEFDSFVYDADGLGAGVRGDARKINETRQHKIDVIPFWGSGAVVDPNEDPFKQPSDTRKREKGRTNEDYFLNAKAQGWYALKKRFLHTYRAVVEGADFNPDDIISIPSKGLSNRDKLIKELSQPTASQNSAGKIIIDKVPDGTRSPNLADAVMIAFAPRDRIAGGMFRV